MTIAAPWWLVLAPVALLLFAAAARVRRRAVLRLQRFGAGSSRESATLRLAPLAAMAGCTVLSVALAEPRLAGDGEARRDPPPCVFALDASRSMLADDVAPNRFAAACAAIVERVRAQPGRRFGVIAFAGAAHELCPPTADADALIELLGTLDPQRIGDAGSDAGRGLARALARLANDERGEIVLLTDGAWDGPGPSPEEVATVARAHGIALAAIGIGGPAEAAPERVAALNVPVNDGARAAVDADAASTPAARRFRTWALFGLVLLAAAHGLAGRDR